MKRLILVLALAVPLLAQPAVLPERARPDAVNAMLKDRLETLLPALMRETGIDMWLVINREYAEDPVYLPLVPEPVFAARRTPPCSRERQASLDAAWRVRDERPAGGR